MAENRYGLIGEKLSHSISPFIHNKLGNKKYALYEIEKFRIDEFFQSNDLSGYNVTIPYKIDAYNYCKLLSDTAQKTKSVNTIINSDKGAVGFNTDYDGFYQMCKSNGCFFKNKKVIVLGSGGASQTIQTVLRDNQCAEITVISRNGENNYNNICNFKSADILINTTPVGMYPDIDQSPVDLSIFDNLEYVIDIIYNPLKTRLILQAESMKIKSIGGLEMLVNQAIKSNEIFGLNSEIEYNDLLIKSKKELQNITLIGMPGCGKSTIGKILANKIGYNFTDTDILIEDRYGKPSAIIKEKGEEYFRLIEKEIIREISKEHRQVIATGGGSVILHENQLNILSNSFVIYLKQNLKLLSKQDRPLSDSMDNILKIFNERNPIYTQMADIEIYVKNNPEETAREIKKCICL